MGQANEITALREYCFHDTVRQTIGRATIRSIESKLLWMLTGLSRYNINYLSCQRITSERIRKKVQTL